MKKRITFAAAAIIAAAVIVGILLIGGHSMNKANSGLTNETNRETNSELANETNSESNSGLANETNSETNSELANEMSNQTNNELAAENEGDSTSAAMLNSAEQVTIVESLLFPKEASEAINAEGGRIESIYGPVNRDNIPLILDQMELYLETNKKNLGIATYERSENGIEIRLAVGLTIVYEPHLPDVDGF